MSERERSVWEVLHDEGAGEALSGGRLELPEDCSDTEFDLAVAAASTAACLCRLIALLVKDKARDEWPRLGASGIESPALLSNVLGMQSAAYAVAAALAQESEEVPAEGWVVLGATISGCVLVLTEGRSSTANGGGNGHDGG